MGSAPDGYPCAVHDERLDRCDKRLELLETADRDHEGRLVAQETRSGDSTGTLRAWGPTILMAIIGLATLITTLLTRRHP
jgi:hypothetical protein